MFLQCRNEFRRAFVHVEQFRAGHLDDLAGAGDETAQPVRPFEAEEDVAGPMNRLPSGVASPAG